LKSENEVWKTTFDAVRENAGDNDTVPISALMAEVCAALYRVLLL